MPMLGQWMVRAGQELIRDADALVPVSCIGAACEPRRFNQSAALAMAISSLRVRLTPQQVGLDKTERPRTCRTHLRSWPNASR